MFRSKSTETKPNFKPNYRPTLASKAEVRVAAIGFFVGACVVIYAFSADKSEKSSNQLPVPTPSTASAPPDMFYASCDGLSAFVTDPAKHEITAIPSYSVANGAKYKGVEYYFGQNLESVTVAAAKDQGGKLVYDFPLKPAAQTDQITAIIEYSLPGYGTFGAVQNCTYQVTFTH